MKRRTPAQHPSLDIGQLPIPAATLDAEQRVTRANAPLRALLGPGVRLRGRRLTAALAAAAEPVQLQSSLPPTTWRFGQGEDARHLRLDLQPLADGSLATFVDVSAEYGALDRLTTTYALRDRLMHDAEVGTWRYDPEADLYYFSSELSLGHEPTPVSPAALTRLQHPEDVAKDAEIRQRITREGGFADGEMRYLRAGGGWTHLHVHYRAGPRTPSGLYEMYGLSQNITALAKSRDEATAGAQRLRLALTAADAGVFEYDLERAKAWVSPEVLAMIDPGLRAARIEHPLMVFHPDDRAAVATVTRAASSGANADPIEVRLFGPEGETWVRLSIGVERSADGRPLRVVGVVLNIDARKRQELALEEARRAAEAATNAKSEFLASVSHEIRTPMNGIVGVLHLLRREPISPAGVELLDEALACSDMLGQLINDVLDLSKIEAGKLELAPEPTDLVQVLRGVVDLLAPQAAAKGLHLRTEVAPSVDWGTVDPIRLRQCLFNLIGNAVKFTLAGGVDVSMARDGEDGAISIVVKDTGIGIPAEARQRLFQRFEQADAATTKQFSGSGLGLAITLALARQMGGAVECDSVEGVGSTFTLLVSAPAVDHSAAAAPDHEGTIEGVRILIVDDNATNRLIGAKILESLGADTSSAADGPTAIELVRQGGFDVVLMDVNMPGMDGLEATRRIRALGPAAGGLPIIALTANVMAHQKAAYLAAGMNGVIAKPFSPVSLVTEIMRAVQASSALRIAV